MKSRKETTSDTPAVTGNSGQRLLLPHSGLTAAATHLQPLLHAVRGALSADGAQVLEQATSTVPWCWASGMFPPNSHGE